MKVFFLLYVRYDTMDVKQLNQVEFEWNKLFEVAWKSSTETVSLSWSHSIVFLQSTHRI